MKLVKIGRSDENDVVLKNDLNISRNHCEIFQDDEGNIFLTDLESANGCFVNGKKVNGSTMLKTNDIVKLGTTVLPWKDYLDLKTKVLEEIRTPDKSKNSKINLEEIDFKKESSEKEKSGFVYKYLSYNDEYITGNQFFLRGMLSLFFTMFLVGLYMYSVAAYKRAKSLGNSDSACNIWAIWGFLVVILAFTPIAFFTNTIPYWYLWWSNGPGKNKQYEIN
tara:strand:+ start:59 stop:721 length:663 start_codon:yes stop_codon:yes gene_type:complete